MTYYAVLIADDMARVFEDEQEACKWAKRQFDKYKISGLLLTCTTGIKSKRAA